MYSAVWAGQKSKRLTHHLRLKRHLNVRYSAQQAVIGIWQHGGTGRENDVVAVGIPASKQAVSVQSQQKHHANAIGFCLANRA